MIVAIAHLLAASASAADLDQDRSPGGTAVQDRPAEMGIELSQSAETQQSALGPNGKAKRSAAVQKILGKLGNPIGLPLQAAPNATFIVDCFGDLKLKSGEQHDVASADANGDADIFVIAPSAGVYEARVTAADGTATTFIVTVK